MTPYNIGDVLCYTRNSNNAIILGTVTRVYSWANPDEARLFKNPQLQGESFAYSLDLAPGHQSEVGHPVTIAHSRVTKVT